MNFPEPASQPHPEPTPEFVSARARRRRAQRRAHFPTDEAGRAQLFHHLTRRAFPSYELFVFSLVAGAILGVTLLVTLPRSATLIALGVFLLAYGAYSLHEGVPTRRVSRHWAPVAGFTGGTAADAVDDHQERVVFRDQPVDVGGGAGFAEAMAREVLRENGGDPPLWPLEPS